jgi:tyrosyl-tRNA synthetase
VAELPRAEVVVASTALDAFVASGISPSKAQARRTFAEGGAYVNNIKVDADATLEAALLLHGRYALLRRGKRTLALAVVV